VVTRVARRVGAGVVRVAQWTSVKQRVRPQAELVATQETLNKEARQTWLFVPCGIGIAMTMESSKEWSVGEYDN
jgi:hypothetical protein